jgi:hypothetical protein
MSVFNQLMLLALQELYLYFVVDINNFIINFFNNKNTGRERVEEDTTERIGKNGTVIFFVTVDLYFLLIK